MKGSEKAVRMRWSYFTEHKEKNEGSMVVEAAMVMPIFLLFVLFLIFIIQMTLYSTALQGTVSDTVKAVSTHIYPAALAVQKLAEPAEGPMKEHSATATWSIPRLSLTEWSSEYASLLPAPLDQWVKAAVQKGEGPLQELQSKATQTVLDTAIKPLLKPYMASDMIQYDRVHVSNVIIPEIKEGTRPYFGLEISYDLPMRVPFLNKRIVLETSAIERLWIGDTGEQDGNSDSIDDENTIMVLEKPNPGVANKQGKIRAKIPPNASANLTIFYKSGKSSAKYLGWKQADENGYIEWEWKIGVNTTPGTWTFTIQTDDGKSLEVSFTVVK